LCFTRWFAGMRFLLPKRSMRWVRTGSRPGRGMSMLVRRGGGGDLGMWIDVTLEAMVNRLCHTGPWQFSKFRTIDMIEV